MVAVVACPVPILSFLNNQGQPNAGGSLLTQVGGVNYATYSDSAGTMALPNPIPLNSRGEVSTATGISSQLFIQTNVVYSFTLFDSGGNQIWSEPYLNGVQITGEQLAALLEPITDTAILNSYGLTQVEQTLGITPANFSYPPGDVRRYGALFNGSNDDTAAINQAITVAGQTVNGTWGATVTMPEGVAMISSMITGPNRVILQGQNKRGTVLRAVPTWNGGTSPAMIQFVGGTWSGGVYTPAAGSMFDSQLQNCTIDGNGVVPTGIYSYAWQDGCGPRSVLILNTTVSCFKFLNGFGGGGTGGADVCPMIDVEAFGNGLNGGSANMIGIDLTTPLGSVAAFKLDLHDVVVAGGTQNFAAGISSIGNSTTSRAVHMEGCNTAWLLDGSGYHTMDDTDGTSSSTTTVITLASTFTGSLKARHPRRDGSTNLLVDNRSGGLGTITGYDVPEITVDPLPAIGPGVVWSAGSFVVSGGVVTVQGSFNCTVARSSAGVFVVTEGKSHGTTFNGVPNATSPQQVGATPLQIAAQHTGGASYTINTDIAGTATDPTGEVNFFNLRLQ